MKKTKFTEPHIVKAINEHENGRDAKEICHELNISKAAAHSLAVLWAGHQSQALARAMNI